MFVKSVCKWSLFQIVCIWCCAKCGSSAYGVHMDDSSKCISWEFLYSQCQVCGDKQFVKVISLYECIECSLFLMILSSLTRMYCTYIKYMLSDSSFHWTIDWVNKQIIIINVLLNVHNFFSTTQCIQDLACYNRNKRLLTHQYDVLV